MTEAEMSQPSDPAYPGEQDPLGGGSATSVLEREEQRELAEPGDHERYAHYVRKEKILASAINGTPVIALCGKVWVPGRDPGKFPVCPVCQEIYDGLRDPQDGDSQNSSPQNGNGDDGK